MIAPFVYWLTAFILLGLACLFYPDSRWRANLRRAMLIFVSSFVFWALVYSIGVQGRISRSTPVIDSDRAEVMLKLGTAFNVLEKGWLQRGRDAFSSPKSKDASAKKFQQEARKILRDSINENPESAELRAKLAILLYDFGDAKNSAEATTLLNELVHRRDQKDQLLGKALLQVYGLSKLSAEDELKLQTVLESRLQKGWYRDAAELQLFSVVEDKPRYEQLHSRLEDKAAGMLLNAVYLIVFAIAAGLIGLIVIAVQLFLFGGRRAAAEEDSQWRSGPDWNLKTVYIVFVSWLGTQIACGSLIQWATKAGGLASYGPLAVAVSTAASYAFSNLPALFYIYWFACRPLNVKYKESIRLVAHSGKLGPVSLVFTGLATWCAAIPVVALACWLGSKLLGAQGSSNPIISLVLDAARSSNSGAILLFFLTLGVLAPLCEESLFRGFLYGSLRKRFGVGISLLVSASLFAAAHLDPGAVVPLLCLGLVFGYVFERTRSLVPSMIAHGLWNSGSFSIMLLVFGS